MLLRRCGHPAVEQTQRANERMSKSFHSPFVSYTQFARKILYEASDMERRLEKNYKSNRIR